MWSFIQRFRRSISPITTFKSHLELGQMGEKIAARFLRDQNYQIVLTNFIAPVGYSWNGRPISAEIDIIAYDRSSRPFILSFVEVKTRSDNSFALPESAVDRHKQRQIVRASHVYRRLLSIRNEPYRYDVVSVILPPEGVYEVKLLKGYFTDFYLRPG